MGRLTENIGKKSNGNAHAYATQNSNLSKMANGDTSIVMDDIKPKPCNTPEEHDKGKCKYKRKILTKDDTPIYMWYRICVCEKYENRREEYDAETTDTDTDDGVYAHYEKSCNYKIHPVREKLRVKYYKLRVQCYCNGKPKYGRKIW